LATAVKASFRSDAATRHNKPHSFDAVYQKRNFIAHEMFNFRQQLDGVPS